MASLEIWNFLRPSLADVEREARRAEAQGWDGITLTDSQNLAPDTYVALGLAARATTRLALGPGVTNPLTRHAAVSAGAIASIQAISDGRAVLGIGRGDSSLFNIGHRPVSPTAFEDYLVDLQRYLAGECVDQNGYPSRLHWLDAQDQPKVPVDVSATGPKVIAVAARHAERVTFALGAEPERVRWALGHLAACVPRDRQRPSPGLYLNVCVDDDVTRATEMVRGMVGTFAHFSGMRRDAPSPARASDAQVFEALDRGYEKAKHGRADAAHARALPAEFITRFAVLGSPERCLQRLRTLVGLGIRRLVIIGPRIDHFGESAVRANARFAAEVMPGLRAAAGDC